MKTGSANSLGVLVTDWAELVDGEADKAAAVQELLIIDLQKRQVPDIAISTVQWQFGQQEAARPFVLTVKSAGYTSATCIRSHGQDLFVSWRLFQQQHVRWENILVFVGVVAPLISAFIAWRSLLGWLITFIVWAAIVVALVGGATVLAYKGLRREIPLPTVSPQANDVLNLGIGIASPLIALFILIRVLSIPHFPSMPSGFISIYVAVLFLGLMGALIAGILTNGDALAYILRVQTVFDADDAIAMALSGYKSILHALDQVGIDTSQLTLHQQTIGGRRGEAL